MVAMVTAVDRIAVVLACTLRAALALVTVAAGAFFWAARLLPAVPAAFFFAGIVAAAMCRAVCSRKWEHKASGCVQVGDGRPLEEAISSDSP